MKTNPSNRGEILSKRAIPGISALENPSAVTSVLPFQKDPAMVAAEYIKSWYAMTPDDDSNVHLLQRFPEGVDWTCDRIDERVPTHVTVEARGLRDFARWIHEQASGAPDRLSGGEVKVLLRGFLQEFEYEDPSLRHARADEHPGLVGRPLTEALNQGIESFGSSDPRLQEIEDVLKRIRLEFDDRGVLAPETMIPWAADYLARQPELRERLTATMDLVVVIDGEDFTESEWGLVEALIPSVPVLNLARENTATARLFNAPGCPTGYIERPPETVPEAVALYLVTGRYPDSCPSTGTIGHLHRPTRWQSWQDVIELVEQELAAGRPPSEIMIVYPDDTSPLASLNAELQRRRLTTAMATVRPSQSPATEELTRLVYLFAEREGAEEKFWKHFRDVDSSTFTEPVELICADVRSWTETATALEQWMDRTRFVDRLTGELEPGCLRSTSTHQSLRTDAAAVDAILQRARGIDAIADDEAANWTGLARELDRLREGYADELVPVVYPPEADGILVTTARVAKHLRRDYVIVPNATAAEQDRLPTIPRLFAREELKGLEGYPANWDVTSDGCASDFVGLDGLAADSHREYFQALKLRQFGLAAQSARETIVFASYRTGPETETRPAWFLEDLAAYFDFKRLDSLSHSDKTSLATEPRPTTES